MRQKTQLKFASKGEKMEEKKGNIVLGIILVILMIIAIVIVIKNPNKIETTAEVTTNKQNETNISKEPSNSEKINKQEEKEISMQEGGTFCKIENQIVFYNEANKSIYLYNTNENKTNKLATLENSIDKIYFDGQNVFCIPNYYKGKGIYKVDLSGNIQKIYEDSTLQLWITEDKIYFVKQIGYDSYNQNPQGTICVMDKDGNNIVELATNVKNYFFIQDDKIYYTTQDRKMYSINADGTNAENLAQGRKFVIATNQKYIVYVDYANQEAKHILNLETKEDSIIGYYGQAKRIQGKIYVNARKRLDDGSIEADYTLFEIKEDGTAQEYSKIEGMESSLKYVSNNKAYIYKDEEIYIINLENNEKEDSQEYKDYKYFLGEYGYKIDASNEEEIKIETIKL